MKAKTAPKDGSDTRQRAEQAIVGVLYEALGRPEGLIETSSTKYGLVAWAPEADEQPTAVWPADRATPVRIHGALKRLMLVLMQSRHGETKRADAAEARLASAMAGGRN